MTKEDFYSILQNAEKQDKLVALIQQFGKSPQDLQVFREQYDPKQHKVMKPQYRRDKDVFKPTGEKDDYGNLKRDLDGQPLTIKTIEPVTRIPIAAQQDITENAAAILCTNKVDFVSKSQNDTTVQTVKDIWEANRMDYLILRMCTIWLSETEVALLWYKDGEEYKAMLLANSEGDNLYPVFDDRGKMIAFGRSYVSHDINLTTMALEEITHVEIYTETEVYIGKGKAGEYTFDTPVLHGFIKIPISYSSRKFPVWWYAQEAIEQKEFTISNLCDTNAYFASPILFGQGDTLSLPAKGEAGKYMEGDKDAKLSYVDWNHTPEPIQMELNLLEGIISDTCKYVNLSISNLKGLFGSAPSSYAIKLLFGPAHQQAAKHEGVFGQFIQRALNILLSATGGEPDSIAPKFTYLLPKDEAAEVSTIAMAKAGDFLSTKTAVTISPTTGDVKKELELVNAEAEKKAAEEAKAAKMVNPVLQ